MGHILYCRRTLSCQCALPVTVEREYFCVDPPRRQADTPPCLGCSPWAEWALEGQSASGDPRCCRVRCCTAPEAAPNVGWHPSSSPSEPCPRAGSRRKCASPEPCRRRRLTLISAQLCRSRHVHAHVTLVQVFTATPYELCSTVPTHIKLPCLGDQWQTVAVCVWQNIVIQ